MKKTQEQIKRQKEKEDNEKIISEIIDSLNQTCTLFPTRLFEIAVGRWKNAKQQTRAAEKEIEEAE